MKVKKLLTGIVVAVMGLTMASFVSANADTKSNYTVTDLRNLQDFILAKETSDLSGKDYDLNGDGRWDVFDMCLMRQEYLKYYNEDDEPKNLVAYYSASGTTEKVADYIAEAVNADVFVITPVDEYTDEDLDWTNSNSRVVYEHNNPDTTHVELVQTVPDNFETYDNVFRKNVIPFCTSMSSPLGDSGKLLAEMSGTGNWFEGMRFTSRSDKETVQNWAKNLDLTKPVNTNKTLIASLSYPLPDGTDANTSASRVIVDGELYGSVSEFRQ